MHRRVFGTILAALLLAAIVAPVAAAAPATEFAPLIANAGADRGANVPSDFRRHTGPYWTWYGPKSWIDSQGQYDLVITSPVGNDMLHLGVSGAPCEDPADYFDAFRAYLKQTGALYSKPLRSSRYTKVGKVRTPAINTWSQNVQFEGKKKSGGGKIRGEADLFYFYDSGSGSCLEQFEIRSSLSDGYHGSIKTLRQVSKHITSNVR